jgi:hypothetical protein
MRKKQMMNKSILKITLLVFSLMLVCSLETKAQDCCKLTDAELVDFVYAKLKPKFADQLNHVNIRIKDRVLTIEGWVAKDKMKTDIEKIISKIKCLKSFTSTLTIGVGGGCPDGTVPCGATCIPAGETCNIRGKGN